MNYKIIGYPIIGGPLDGDHALLADFYRAYGQRAGGKFAEYADEYSAYNRANRWNKVPSMVWLHRSLLP